MGLLIRPRQRADPAVRKAIGITVEDCIGRLAFLRSLITLDMSGAQPGGRSRCGHDQKSTQPWASMLLVVPRNPRRPDRRRLDDSPKVLCGTLFGQYTGIRRESPPHELGFGL
ncbi:hypothetical protein [Streptomyces sp. cg40]|uniref:hypothetical protein n=1 Tax=Streptomyces sp. cg40 TaxID=3419764 RepID=UPI003D04E70E